MVSASGSQFGGLGFESRSGHLLDLIVSKYLSRVPVSQLDKLRALSTINKHLNL